AGPGLTGTVAYMTNEYRGSALPPAPIQTPPAAPPLNSTLSHSCAFLHQRLILGVYPHSIAGVLRAAHPYRRRVVNVDTPTREAACLSRGERVRLVRSFADLRAGMVGTVYSVVPGPTITYVVCFD